SHQIGRSVANFNFTNEPPTSPNATTTPPSSPANDQRGSHRSFLGGLLDRLPAALRGNSANSPNSQRHRTGSGPQEEAAAAAGEEAQQRQQPGAGGMQRAGSQAGAVAGEAALRERRLTINTQQQQQLQLRPSQSFGAAPAALRCGSGSGSGNGGMPRQESANGRINGRKSSSGVAGPLSRLGGVPASMRGSASPRLSRIGREQQLQPAAAQQPGGRSAAGAGANGGGYVVGAPAPDRSSPLSGAKRPQPPQPQSPALPLQPSEQQPQPPSSPPLQPLQPPQVQVLVQVEIGPGEVAVAGQAATEAAAAEAPCSSGSSGSSGESGRAVLGGVDRMGRASPPPLPVHPEPYAAEGDAAAGAPPVGRQEV
ncbi:hypothetical protein PLESTB_001195800, partial [Pleodorina starrii]